MFAAVLALATALSAPAATVAFSDGANLQAEVVRLGDIADLSSLPASFRGDAAGLAITRLMPGQTLRLDKGRLAERIRSLLPVAAPWFGEVEPGTIFVSRAPAPRAAPRLAETCIKAAVPLTEGDYVLPAMLEPAVCDPSSGSIRWIYSSADGRARAARGIAAGEVLPAPQALALADVRPGQPVRLRVNVGPVVLEREVLAAQAGSVGRPLFVRTAAGDVFSAANWEPVQ
ncbi:MAG TPA: hypothetical protein VF559_03110 [Caulobacteraceae bacterium]|jgi:hypothetical protein